MARRSWRDTGRMVFQSLLSTVTSASSSSGSGFIGGGLGGSPPENGGALCGGVSKDSPSKHYLIGSVRTFNDIPPQAERTNRRSMRPDQGAKSATSRDGGDAAAAPTFGWWSWRKVEEGAGDAADGREGGATLFAMEKSLTSWEKDANERLNDWQHAEEVVPLFRSSVSARSSCNYGTFARRDFLYSGAAACATPSSATTHMASSSVERAECDKSDSSSSSTSSRSNEERHGTAQAQSAAGSASAHAASFVEHVLRPGDTLSALAVKYQVHVNDITRANGISGMGSNSLLVRKSLKIPVLSCSFAVPPPSVQEEHNNNSAPAPFDATPAAALPAEDESTEDSTAATKHSKEERKAAKGERKRSEKEGERGRNVENERVVGADASYQSAPNTRSTGAVDPIAARLQAVAHAAVTADAAHTPQ